MKKINKIVLSLFAVLCLAGCSKQNSSDYNNDQNNDYLMFDKDLNYSFNLNYGELYKIN